ncbi:MAG: 4Fe-4S ferredoxin [Deltaproteobacteria bacterium]|nr:MAG: 4Fe-4S ferredoxin [Deltaproteobacteria bacterium]
MEAKLIKKDALAEVVKRIAGQKLVYAPVKDGSRVNFKYLDQGESAFLDYGNSTNAPKNIFFPQTETMMRYTRTDKGNKLVSAQENIDEMVLFGVRPCDLRSFKLLDMVFDQEKYSDPYYVKRRQQTTIVAMACRQPPSSICFCTSVGGHPYLSDGADILISELDDNEFLVEFLSSKGESLAKLFGSLDDATDTSMARKNELSEASAAAIKSTIPATEIKPWLDENFDHPYWDTIHQSCLACGTCSYLCPTCHCFDIKDEVTGDDGLRLRTWDSCMYSIYSKETSGHNPRPGQKQRWRQRLMHKFKYFVDNFNAISCVGCGRCVANCPVNTDIRKVVSDIAKL